MINHLNSVMVDVDVITEDHRFASFLPALHCDDYDRLKQSIATEGVRDPLTVWHNVDEYVLVDGYNRLGICRELGIKEVYVVIRPFANYYKAEEWVITNQLARRNLTDIQRAHFIGLLYRMEQRGHGGEREGTGRKSKAQNGLLIKSDQNDVFEASDSKVQNEPLNQNAGNAVSGEDTATRIAKQFGVSRNSVKRAGYLAGALERIAEVEAAARDKLLSGAAKKTAPMKNIEKLAKASDAEVAAAAAAIMEDRPIAPPPPKTEPAPKTISGLAVDIHELTDVLIHVVDLGLEANTLNGDDIGDIRALAAHLTEVAAQLREFIGDPPAPAPAAKTHKMTAALAARFERFWDAYPRRVARGRAERVWARIGPDDALTDRMVKAIYEAEKFDNRFGGELQYVPHPVTWLNGCEWENEYSDPSNLEYTEKEKERINAAIAARRAAAAERIEQCP